MKTKLPSHRIEGAFLGLALGDAYGRTLEFVSGEAVQQNAVLIDRNSFMWSEETHISMYVADAVLQMPQSKFEGEQFGHLLGSYLTTWMDDPLMPATNPGNTTLAGIRNYKKIKDWTLSGVRSGDGSAAVTRLCPIALAYDGSVLDEASQIAAQITHAHPNAIASAFATARLLRTCLTQGTLSAQHIQEVISELDKRFDAPEVSETLSACLIEIERTDLEWLDDAQLPLGDGGWRCPSTLGLALIATLKWGDDIPLAIEKAARISGDSDAVAALTGMFLGGTRGVSQLPNNWLSVLPQREEIRTKSRKLQNILSKEILSIADQIRSLQARGAHFSTANIQTNTVRLSVDNQAEDLMDSLKELNVALGEILEENDSTTSVIIDRSLVPNDVRKSFNLHVPKPIALSNKDDDSNEQSEQAPKTSTTHPIEVDWVLHKMGNGDGSLGITFAPGKKSSSRDGIPWDRNLNQDLDRLKSIHQVDALISVVENHELKTLQIPKLVSEANFRRIAVLRSPIVDGSVPTLEQAKQIIQFALTMTFAGQRVVIHCKGGLGRAGTLCACALIHFGYSPEESISIVRESRKGAVENSDQEKFVAEYAATYRPQ
jgi:ADP-ribosylglycohydrolase/protein-tyrosine phosphatase